MKKILPLAAALLLAACGGWGHCDKMKGDCCSHSNREALSDRPLGSVRDSRHAPIQYNAETFRELPTIGYCEKCNAAAKSGKTKAVKAAPVDAVESKPTAKPAAKVHAKEEKKGWLF